MKPNTLCATLRTCASSALIFCLFTFSFCLASAAADGPVLSYRKVFRSSSPEYIEIKVRQGGVCTFDIRQLEDDPDPQPFQVNPGLVSRMFALAGELNHFRGIELDVKRRLANLGEKTFRYENAGTATETKFNYTVNPSATQLMQIFEGLSRQQEHIQMLSHRVRFDRLGVNDGLLRLEADLNRRYLPEPERLLPILNQIAADSRVVEIARQKARALAERIKNGK